MTFGNRELFAIQADWAVQPGYPTIYVHFCFWIAGIPIGDKEDRISFVGSITGMKNFCNYAYKRRELVFQFREPAELFQYIYHNFYECDDSPDFRSWFHMDSIGLGALEDKYGVILVASSDTTDRLVVKDLRLDSIVADIIIPAGYVETTGKTYIEWGESQLQQIT